jgi:hypothetical protein
MTMRATFNHSTTIVIYGSTPDWIMEQWAVIMNAWRRVHPTVFCVCEPIQMP